MRLLAPWHSSPQDHRAGSRRCSKRSASGASSPGHPVLRHGCESCTSHRCFYQPTRSQACVSVVVGSEVNRIHSRGSSPWGGCFSHIRIAHTSNGSRARSRFGERRQHRQLTTRELDLGRTSAGSPAVRSPTWTILLHCKTRPRSLPRLSQAPGCKDALLESLDKLTRGRVG